MLVMEEGNTWHSKVAKDQILSGSVATKVPMCTGMAPQQSSRLYDGTVSFSGGFLFSSALPREGV
jgi:hypothetical protein